MSCYIFSNAQQCYTVYDSISRKPLPYAAVWKNDKVIANGDEAGKFCSDLDGASKYVISYMGYSSKPFNDSTSEIYLTEEETQLREVVVRNKKIRKHEKIGNTNYDIALTATYDLQISEIAMPFYPTLSDVNYLNKIKFRSLTSSKNRILGVKFYSIAEDGKPLKLLSQNPLICNPDKGSSITVLDFKENPIFLGNQNFFVALQLLLVEDNKQFNGQMKQHFFYEPSIGATRDKNSYYFSQSEEGRWVKQEGIELSIQVELTN